jgi:hypothetical protein
MGLLKSTGAHITPSLALIPEMKLQDLVFALLDFGLALVPSIHSMPPFLPFGMGMFTLCHCRLEARKLMFYFYRVKHLPES